MKQLFGITALAAVLAMAPTGVAHAAKTFTYTQNLEGEFQHRSPILTDAQGRAISGSFTDTYTFNTTKFLLGSFTLTSTGGSATTSPTYLKFNTVTINGTRIPVTITTGRTGETRTGSLLDFRLPAGLQTLVIGGDTGTNGSYSGSFSLVAVPEPATWGMMILGFGLIGVSMRRRSSNVRTSVRFA